MFFLFCFNLDDNLFMSTPLFSYDFPNFPLSDLQLPVLARVLRWAWMRFLCLAKLDLSLGFRDIYRHRHHFDSQLIFDAPREFPLFSSLEFVLPLTKDLCRQRNLARFIHRNDGDLKRHVHIRFSHSFLSFVNNVPDRASWQEIGFTYIHPVRVIWLV